MNTAQWIAILNLATTYGIPAISAIVAGLSDDEEITVEKVASLAALVQEPDSYDIEKS